ncbi:MAG: isocitrate lyase [Acidobacteria bacterium RIFCSPLOWO2_12_FULL_54_10]|nr:MAG: isocitrate lyase [Acidobacteria bacterium RIFCSPLOWO2_12_FULL_54_10]
MQGIWAEERRRKGIVRPYRPDDVIKLRGTVHVEHTLSRLGAERLWRMIETEPYIAALGAMTANQAVEQVRAGLKAIYCSGWQVAADANEAGQMYPDLSLYPADSVPALVRRINNALLRADQIQKSKGEDGVQWFAPIVADGEAGFGGNLNVFELTKWMIEAGASAIHLEDQLSSAKKCGHMGGKVLVPTREFIQKLIAARLAADCLSVPLIVVARTDALGANLLTSDVDPWDQRFLTGERTEEGFFHIRHGLDSAIARALAYAPYADLLWFETSEPDMDQAKKFAEAVHEQFPGKALMYNCSPSFNWKLKLSADDIARFQSVLGKMGYKFQFITLAGFHALNYSMFKLAAGYKTNGMTEYANMQEQEFHSEKEGYTAVRHQEFVGTGYFDDIAQIISGGHSSTLALVGSTEESQFHEKSKKSAVAKKVATPKRAAARK